MRAYHKGWQDKRPNPARWVKWYQQLQPTVSIRLHFEEHYPGGGGRSLNVFYTSVEAAEVDFEAFAAGTLTVVDLVEREHA